MYKLQPERAYGLPKLVKYCLLFCAAMATITALAHLSCIYLGEQCYRSQLAPPVIIESAIQGTWLAPVASVFISLLFLLCGIYALAGANIIRTIPLQRLALLTLAILCTLRGLAAVPLSVIYWQQTTGFSLLASLLWFLCGCGFAVGWYFTRPATELHCNRDGRS
ncbi:hypothetical protein [Pseudoalteromonas sp. MMG022]|uniref:hypothetical protein n=1 Tax=Pseudoalteromonas sp. MMG022 TaxID=2909978 RepID=UPI001F34FD27|nr:hypothetical protein [Pseudoalteromonas sp. MMG022]MCF6436272.1 hypothetical protein [Pseudoalteromonas sp. MMG022]